MKFTKISLFYFLLPFQVSFGQNLSQKLESAYQQLIADEQAKYALTSLCILDANTGEVLFAKNEQLGMATASTLKTITAASAYALLGRDFRYQTSLAYNGFIDSQGILQGDLLLIGRGDPTLGSWRYPQTREDSVMEHWVKAIRDAGIKVIKGRIIGDDRLWGTQSLPEGWIWQDMGNYYGAGSPSLSWRENQFDVHLKAGKTLHSEVTVVKMVPEMPYLTLVNELSTGPQGSGDNAYAFLPPYGLTAYLRGSWGIDIRKQAISLSLPDPAYELAYRLRDTLLSLQIPSDESTSARRLSLENKEIAPVKKEIHQHSSPSLDEIVYWFNKKSVNLYGEQLLKTIASQQGMQGTTANGTKAVIQYWAKKGIDPKALRMIDGSGLSPGNRVTTFAMAQILYLIRKETWFAPFFESLPENNGMQLKSGSINGVSAYAGYYTDKKGKSYVVVININNYNGGGISKKLFRALDALKD